MSDCERSRLAHDYVSPFRTLNDPSMGQMLPFLVSLGFLILGRFPSNQRSVSVVEMTLMPQLLPVLSAFVFIC